MRQDTSSHLAWARATVAVRVRNLSAWGGGESQGNERFLLQFVGLGRAGCGAGAGRPFYGADLKIFRLGDAFEARQNKEERAPICGFFLAPDDFTGVGVSIEGGGNFILRQRVKLIEEEDRGGGVLAAGGVGAGFMRGLSS